MKIDKFVNKLRNEAKANPKKAGMLALLLVVALWFWAPLLAKWFSPSSDSIIVAATAPADSAATTPPEIAVDANANSGVVNNKTKIMQFAWRDISNWIQRDPRMTPAADLPASKRDPFRPVPKVVPPPPPPPKPVVKEVIPDTLDFKLASTMVGTHRKTARINGKSYTEGDLIETDAQPDISFEITEITTRKVVLKRADHFFELKLNAPEMAGKDKPTKSDASSLMLDKGK